MNGYNLYNIFASRAINYIGNLVCVLIMVFSILGNSLVILSVRRFHRMKTPTNILLAR